MQLKSDSDYSLDMPSASCLNASPPSTFSSVEPFVQFDSTSSSSSSNDVHGDITSLQNAQEIQTQRTATQSNLSCTSVCLDPSSHHKLPIDNICARGISLEQHLQNSNVARKVTTQSFILERFLPAARTVAAAHNRSNYSLRKPMMTAEYSTTACSSPPATTNEHASTSAMEVPKNHANEYVDCCNGEVEYGSDDVEMLAKSCGFSWAGLRSAMFFPQNKARAAPGDLVTKKSTATKLFYRGKNFERDLQSEGETTSMEGTQYNKNTCTPDFTGFFTMPPSNMMATAKANSSFLGDPNDNSTNLNASPTDSTKCPSRNLSHVLPSSVEGRFYDKQQCIFQQDTLTLNRLYSASQEECNRKNDCHLSEKALMDSVTAAADNELDLHEASSASDMLACRDNSGHSSKEIKAAKCQDPSFSVQIPSSDVSKLFEANLVSAKGKGTSELSSDNDGHLEVAHRECSKKSISTLTSAFASKGNSRCDTHLVSSGCEASTNGASFNHHQKTIHHSPEKPSTVHLHGWPLGISSLQSGACKSLLKEIESVNDEGATKSPSAEQLRHDGDLNQESTDEADKGMDLGSKCEDEKGLRMRILSPPAPPSPTSSSWLAKALALKASKPPLWAALKQREYELCSKKQEFMLQTDSKKGSKWEDVVKSSQVC